MIDLLRRAKDHAKSVFRARPTEKLVDWARRNIELSTKESGDFPGKYDPDLNPLPTILFEVYQSGQYNRFVFKKSSQSGVTLVCLILICWYITYGNRNFLYVIDKLDEMRRISKERLQPMIKRCSGILSRITPDPDDLTNLTLSFKGLVGYLCGSNSLGGLANKSIGLAVFDETDTYKNRAAVSVGSERGKKQTSFSRIELSKPEDEEGHICTEYLKGSRHRPFFACPHCGTMQTVEWERIIYSDCKDLLGAWDYDLMNRGIYLRCVNGECNTHAAGAYARSKGWPGAGGVVDEPSGGRIHENWKPFMIANREWRATNDGSDGIKPIPGLFSCQLDDLMSTFPTAAWPLLVQEWLEALEGGDEEKMKTFVRGRLARGWKHKEIKVDSSDIFRMKKPYKRGQCPVEPAIVLMACDVQQIVRKWVKVAFTLNGDCYVVDWGECFSFAELVNIADEPVEVLKWNDDTPPERRVNPVVHRGLVDEGFIQTDVREFCVETRMGVDEKGLPVYRFSSVWGQSGMRMKSARDIVYPGADGLPNVVCKGWPMWAYRFSDDNFKHELYNNRIGGYKEWEAAIREGKTPPAKPRLWFPVCIEQDRGFVNELCQERFQFDEKSRTWGWVEPEDKNDFGDALKMCHVAWYLCGPIVQLAHARAQAAREAAMAAAPLN